MRIDGARREGNSLVLETSDSAAWRFLMDFKAGEYEITKARKKRSLDANAYSWVLIDEIAKVLHYSKEEVYRRAVREYGVSEVYCGLPSAIQILIRAHEGGLGFQYETFESKVKGCLNVRLYFGQSSYDTKQMSVFIDGLVQDAKSLDIETLSDRELTLLKEGWK
jgi:hypothetical protein